MGLGSEISSAVKWDSPSVDMQGTLRTAINKMVNNGVSALVVKSGDKVVGVVTDMDFMRCIAKGDDLDGVTVSSFMTSCEVISGKKIKIPCIQLDTTQSVKNAIGLMDLAGVHHLFVAGEEGAGVISAQDLLRLVVD
ncbi:MAG: CBS domain-containing protein [Deltaproteobacteria bacterium]|nr:CBS domain-containing protein [Deltaproteobacteria bacterium]